MINFFKKTAFPILLGAMLVTMIIDIYNPEYVVASFIGAALIMTVLFVIFGFFRRFKYVGGLFYVVVLLFFLFGMLSLLAMSFLGRAPLVFTEWFYGAQDAGTYFLPYTLLVFFGFSFFFASVLFYFTQIIYRSAAVLLCMIVPFAIYAKRYENPSLIYIALVLAIFFGLMIHQRQMSDKNVVTVMDRSYTLAAGTFVFAVLVVAMIFPKVEVTPLRQKLDDFIESLEMGVEGGRDSIGEFYTESLGSNFGSNPTGQIFFYVSAEEPLLLKIQSYDTYSGDRKWAIDKEYYEYGYDDWEDEARLDINRFIEAADGAIRENEDLREYIPYLPEQTDNKKTAYITPNEYMTRYILTTNRTYEIKGTEGNNFTPYRSGHGDVFIGNAALHEYKYKVYYYSQNTDIHSGVDRFVSQYSRESWEDVCDNLNMYDSAFQTVKNFRGDLYEAYEYYDSTYQPQSARMSLLAAEITEGCYSDYEKAVAIRDYFRSGEYTYMIGYEPTDSDIETFIFEDKTGLCVDYATAMTLLARECGLPARYTEGFNCTEELEPGFYVVRDEHAHAFCEVYISGYGWMTFDATPPSDELGEGEAAAVIDAKTIRTTVVVAVVAVLFAAVLVIIFPFIVEWIFLIRTGTSDRTKASVMIYVRIGKLLGKKYSFDYRPLTPVELCGKASELIGVDISAATSLTEKACYGKILPTKEEISLARECYKRVKKGIKKKR